MNGEHGRETELRVLGLTDNLIETVMTAGAASEMEREEQIELAQKIVVTLCDLLMSYLDGKSHYLENLVKQLAGQKLPDSKIMDSFTGFRSDLDRVISLGVNKFLQGRAENAEQGGRAVESNTNCSGPELQSSAAGPGQENTDGGTINVEITLREGKPPELRQKQSLGQILNNVFPGELLLNNYKLQGVTLSYYFPQKGLVVEQAGLETEIKNKVQGMGLRVVEISANDAYNPKAIERLLRRSLLS